MDLQANPHLNLTAKGTSYGFERCAERERASHKGKAPPPAPSFPLSSSLLRQTACEAAAIPAQLASRDILVIRATISPWERQWSPLYSGGALAAAVGLSQF